MKKMKKLLALCLCLALLLALAGCGKSEYVKNAEALIAAIGEVDADSGEAIEAAQKAFDALSDKDKEQVENADLLPRAKALLAEALAAKAAAEQAALEASFLGSWRAELDEVEILIQSVDGALAEQSSLSFRDYIDSFIIPLVLEFNEDGSYRMIPDTESMGETIVQLKASVVNFYEDFLLSALCTELEASGYGSLSSWEDIEKLFHMDKDTLIQYTLDTTLPEFVDELFSDETIEDLYAEMSREGKYSVEPGKLHLSADPDSEPTEGDYESFTMEGDVLTLTDFAGTSVYEDLVYPMSFTRVG